MPNFVLPRVFISYSRADSQFVDRLEADLRARGFDVWVDRRRLEGGQKWDEEIKHAIDLRSAVLVLLSPASVMSQAVRTEYEYALGQQKQIVPLLLRPCPMPSQLERFQWIDFMNAAYALGLKELVYALLSPEIPITADSRDLYAQSVMSNMCWKFEGVDSRLAG